MSRRASQALLGLLTHSYKLGIFYYPVGPGASLTENGSRTAQLNPQSAKNSRKSLPQFDSFAKPGRIIHEKVLTH
jgi:hypothetical protein